MTSLKILFSSALPESEETGFEEQFKYLIVTSSVLNEISSQQTTHTSSSAGGSASSNTDLRRTIPLTTYYSAMGLLAFSGALLFVFSFVNFVGALCFHWTHPSYLPLFLVQATFLGVLFIVYRNLRYIKIRRAYGRLLDHLQQIIHDTGISDHLMDQLIGKIRDVETISQGYTLTPANSALEQPRSHQSPQTLGMRHMARSILIPYYKSVTTLLKELKPLTHPSNLTTLRGMYNVKAFSPLGEDDIDDESTSMDLEQVDYLVYMIRASRREWFMRLLALEMMTLGHDSARRDYEVMLDIVERMMMDMEQQTKDVTRSMKRAMISDLYDEPEDCMDETMPNQRSRMVLNKLVLLEKHLRNLQTKIVLCRHDAKGISLDKGADYSFNRIGDRFGSMEQDISHLLAQWDENKNVLLHIINSKRSSTSASLPSPPSSPATSIDSVSASSMRSYTTTTAEPIVTVSSTPSSQQQSSAWPPVQQRFTPHSPPPQSSPLPALHPPKPTHDVHLSDHQLLSVATTNPSLSSRQSWITAAAVASFLESRRVYRLQTQHKQKEVSLESDRP
ncbi:hypothetical protein [Absidia glauca]|uniref:Myosin-binding domain-containing protein n=1 Tax=Absidia glauca TaxID=4829 RepID=A0A163JXY3_ABSGL|nr:hypothetical protein [Absidia glauca]